MKQLIFFCCLVASLCGQLSWSEKIVFNERFGVRAQALGGAYRAVSTGNDAIYFNPAGMVFNKTYDVDLEYFYQGNLDPHHWAGASLVDSVTAALAAGLDIHAGFKTENKPLNYDILGNLALAYPLADIFSMGLTLRYAFVSDPVPEQSKHHFTGDVGLMLRLPLGISLAVVGYNLIPTQMIELPLSVGFGGAFHWGSSGQVITNPATAYTGFTLAADFLMRDLTKIKAMELQFATGAEYYIADLVPIRLGYTFEITQNKHYISGGLGLLLQVIEVDFTFQQNLFESNDQTYGAALRFFFL